MAVGSYLQTSLVFQALCRPAMILGVDYDYCFICGLAVMLLFIYSSNLLALLVMLPLHAVGWVLCKLDPHIFRLLSIRANIGCSWHLHIWRCQSYGAY